MVVKHRINNRKCPQCETILNPVVVEGDSVRYVEYQCPQCGYKESDHKPIDVDTRYAPTFKTLPIIKI